MVECTGLENRRGRKASGGSNPPASARIMAARSGALRRYELYGNPGTADGRIKGGTVSQRKFQDNPEQANLSGFKIRRDITRPERSALLAEFPGIYNL